jgi:hypothetical protein
VKKILWIKDSEEFWEVFSKEREKRREQLRKLPFAKKIEIISKMQKMAPPKRAVPKLTNKQIGKV